MAPSQRSAPSARRSLNAGGMRLPQRGEYSRDDLIDAEARGIDGHVRARVIGLPRAIERLDVHGRALEHRPAAEAARALEQLGQISAQPHDGAEGAQRLHAVIAAGQPAARRDHVARLQRECLEHLALQTAKRLLTALPKDLGNRAAAARDDPVAGLNETTSEAPRELQTAHRLWGADATI